MGQVREELTLIDKFTSVFDRFINACSTSASHAEVMTGATQAVERSMQQAAAATGYWTDQVGTYDKSALEMIYTTQELVDMGYKTAEALTAEAGAAAQAATATEQAGEAADDAVRPIQNTGDAANQSTDKLSDLAMQAAQAAIAFAGLQKASEALNESMDNQRIETILAAKLGSGKGEEIINWLHRVADEGDNSFNELATAYDAFLATTGKPGNIEKMMNMSERLSKFGPKNLGFDDAATAIQRSLMTGQARMLESQYNLRKADLEKYGVTKFAKSGDTEKFITALEKVLDLNGKTAQGMKALEETGSMRLAKLTNKLHEGFLDAGNGIVNALSPVFLALTNAFDNKNTQQFFEMVAGGIAVAAQAISSAIQWFTRLNDICGGYLIPTLTTLFAGLLFGLLVQKAATAVQSIGAMAKAFLGLAGAEASAALPITLIILALALLAVAVVKYLGPIAGTTLQFAGEIANGWIGAFNMIIDAAQSVANAVIDMYKALAKLMHISTEGVKNVDFSGSHIKMVDPGKMAAKAFNWGAGIDERIWGNIDKLTKFAVPPNQKGTLGDVGTVHEVGKINGPVKLADEDLKMMVDLAERQFVAKVNLSHNTPSIHTTVTNNYGQELDAYTVADHIKGVLLETMSANTNTSYAEVMR